MGEGSKRSKPRKKSPKRQDAITLGIQIERSESVNEDWDAVVRWLLYGEDDQRWARAA